jgi:hypothetical protein
MPPNLWRSLARKIVEAAELESAPRTSAAPQPPLVDDGTTPEGIFREVAARQLDVQVTTNDVLDSRNTNIVWVGSTVVTVTFGLLAISQLDLPWSAEWSLKASLGWYVLLLGASWWASHYRGLGYRPDLFDLARYSESYSTPLLERWVAIEYTRSADDNEQLLKKKARWVGAANTLLYLEGLSLSIAALLTLL